MEIGIVIRAMTAYYAGDPRRVGHFLKVYGFAKAIGEAEGLDNRTQEILELAALTHDIGIRNSERKFGRADGVLQETEGPPEAKTLLNALNAPPETVERVCWLIAHHHTYTSANELDHRILVEADFLVNAFEDNLSEAAIRRVGETVFRTKTGLELLRVLYGTKD